MTVYNYIYIYNAFSHLWDFPQVAVEILQENFHPGNYSVHYAVLNGLPDLCFL